MINADDPRVAGAGAARTRARAAVLRARAAICRTASCVDGDAIVGAERRGDASRWCRSTRSSCSGRIWSDDVMAAAAVGWLAGVDAGGDDRARSKASPASSTRWSWSAEIGGVRFVNDSKATNVEAALRAIESFDAGVVVIIGGRFKGGDFARSARAARERGRRGRGDRRGAAAGSRRRSADACRCTTRGDMAAAVRTAFALGAPGRRVLLAPACASFDMFRDYAERGRAFKEEVQRLRGRSGTVTREQ